MVHLTVASCFPAIDNYIDILKPIRLFRSFIGSHCLFFYGKNIIIEHKADFGSGNNICIGNNSGLGVCCCVGGRLHGDDVIMMGSGIIMLEVGVSINLSTYQ